MTTKKIIILVSIFMLVITLSSFLSKKDKSWEATVIPPGTLKIDTNLYMDYIENTNFYWFEYMCWTERVFGDSSITYLETKPFENSWLFEDTCLYNYSDYYLRHPAYRDYPVVNITQKQVIDYLNWRSDRVLELLLIREGILEHDPRQDKDYYVSIENYFAEKLKTKGDKKITIYPHYRLPTEAEWKKGKVFYDNYNATRIKKLRKKYCEPLLKDDTLAIRYNFNPCIEDSTRETSDPMLPTTCYKSRKLKLGTHFYGNVSEWLFEEHKIIGGNWKDTTTTHFSTAISATQPATTIGFRAVCEWKTYQK